MYDIGRRVYVKSLGITGEISERNWTTGLMMVGNKRTTKRRAEYLVVFEHDGRHPYSDYLTGSDDLVPADFNCDGCGAWRATSQSAGGPRDRDGGLLAEFCFLCNIIAEKEHGRH